MPFTKRLVFPKYMKGLPNSDEYFDLYTKVREYFHDHSYPEQIVRNYFKIFVEIGYIDAYEKVLEKCLKIKSYGRALTLEKFKCLYGDDEGEKRWKLYCDRQAYTNSKEYFIEKYGEDGINEYELTNLKKSHTYESYLLRFYGDKRKATNEYRKYINGKNIFSSNIANDFFISLYGMIKNQINKCYTKFLNHEYAIYDHSTKQCYMYDFVLPDLKVCIEYNGDVFHANPKIYKKNDHPNPYNKRLTSEQIWFHDSYKNSLIQNRGYDIFIVWECDDRNCRHDELMRIYNLIVDKINGCSNYEEW